MPSSQPMRTGRFGWGATRRATGFLALPEGDFFADGYAGQQFGEVGFGFVDGAFHGDLLLWTKLV